MKNTRGTGLRLLRAAPVLLLLLVPLRLAGQSAQNSGPTSVDDVIKQETYATPPRELAEAVLAPRHLNISLTSASPDKKWFLDEIGDGPVAMKTFGSSSGLGPMNGLWRNVGPGAPNRWRPASRPPAWGARHE